MIDNPEKVNSLIALWRAGCPFELGSRLCSRTVYVNGLRG